MLRSRTGGVVVERNGILKLVVRSHSTPGSLVESKTPDSGNVAAYFKLIMSVPVLQDAGRKSHFKFILLNRMVCAISQCYLQSSDVVPPLLAPLLWK